MPALGSGSGPSYLHTITKIICPESMAALAGALILLPPSIDVQRRHRIADELCSAISRGVDPLLSYAARNSDALDFVLDPPTIVEDSGGLSWWASGTITRMTLAHPQHTHDQQDPGPPGWSSRSDYSYSEPDTTDSVAAAARHRSPERMRDGRREAARTRRAERQVSRRGGASRSGSSGNPDFYQEIGCNTLAAHDYHGKKRGEPTSTEPEQWASDPRRADVMQLRI